MGATGAHAEKRVALVIGNGAYANAPRLPNPKNDAEDVAAALSRMGFETFVGLDLDQVGMQERTIEFARAARTADIAVFYYSGHAMQLNGVNYLMPVDASLKDEADLRRMARVDEIVYDLQQASKLRILVLDACRDNPLAEELKRSIGRTRAASIQRGLAGIDSAQGMIVSYATQSGSVADDGRGRNSPYTTAFLRHIEQQAEIGQIFRRITADVYEGTRRTQLPELSLSLIGEMYLKGRPAPVAAAAPAPAPPADPTAGLRAAYGSAAELNTIEAWDAFLATYKDRFYADLARQRRERLVAAQDEANRRVEIARLSPGPSGAPGLPPVTGPSPAEVARLLQTELQRVGCFVSSIDGEWGRRSRDALERFNTHAGMRLDAASASIDALEVVRGRTARVCPLECARGYEPDGDRCVAVKKPPAATTTAKPATAKPKPAAKPATTSTTTTTSSTSSGTPLVVCGQGGCQEVKPGCIVVRTPGMSGGTAPGSPSQTVVCN